ncbi:putative carboxypeptidase D [Lupinus albus]|uniref:Putative carboxypeptidase D n=1 Tax=Lupinus albus TaxID=3870 RepID=A0A6A4NDJ5_LUPAL|nr:putative carboxypeptidase D [Lupinus albus]
MGKSSCLALISLLIISFFMNEICGSKQGQVFDKFQKSKYKVDSRTDRSDFNAQEVVVDNHIVHYQKGLKEKDRIDKLPGQPHVNFSQYGGYVTIDKLAGRAFYYYFVESQHSNEKMPLLLWLNGGMYNIFLLFLIYLFSEVEMIK